MDSSAKFAGQFIISTKGWSSSYSTQRIELLSVDVEVFPGISITEVWEQSGKKIGVLLGVVVDLDGGQITTDRIVLPTNLIAAHDLNQLIEAHIYRYVGSFVFVLDTGFSRRVYLDANGTLSLVYDRQMGIAASTSHLLLSKEEYESRFQAALYDAFDIKRDGWFTAGLTAHRGVRRLLCNHYLDLETGEAVRHWPIAGIERAVNPEEAIAVINDIVNRTVRALRSAGPVVVALTAGNETRALLACCRAFLNDISFVTVDAPGYRVDRVRAGELARRFKLRHRVLPYRKATTAGAEAWRARAGHCITGNNMIGHPSVEPLIGEYFIGGLGGEVGRGFLWLNATRDTPIDAQGIVDRLKLPRHPLILAEVNEWLRPLGAYDTLFKLDLAYIELRMSCWAFAQSYTSPQIIKIYPLISRRSYVAMLSLPPELRRNNGMIVSCIEQAWSELLDLPINKYGDFRDKIELAEKLLRKPYRAWRKFRQLFRAAH